MSAPITWVVAALTHVGVVRQKNEDCLHVDGWISNTVRRPLVQQLSGPAVVAVIDGMGGHPGGDVASLTAANGLSRVRLNAASSAAEVNQRLQEVADLVHDTGQTTEGLALMGATTAGLVLSDNGPILFNVGDCSIIRVRDGYAGQLAVIDRRELPEGGSAVTQCLGGTGQRSAVDAHAEPILVGEGDTYVLCSDGLTDVVGTPEIANVVAGAGDPAAIASELVALACRGGAPDNVSVIVLQPVFVSAATHEENTGP
jgi:PPM family protein phosphatase